MTTHPRRDFAGITAFGFIQVQADVEVEVARGGPPTTKTGNRILAAEPVSLLRPGDVITGTGGTFSTKSAEEKGFEPLVQLPVRRFSKPLP